MLQIEREKSFKAENVLSLRRKVTQSQANEEMNKIAKYLKENSLKQTGPIITATFAIDSGLSEPLIDMEILVPIDKKISSPVEYKFKDIFHIKHAVHAKHVGTPATLHKTYNDLFTYIKENNLQQITTAYNVYIKNIESRQPADNLNIDVYIGVNPSVL
ncbi:GyrI-like domain-containing protein [Ruminiclostridium papyrosolvens]|uniref:Transcriptional regulator n=1 Tax=Ruminiclostridium papyrosolvens C7 TaxID=1330534 RepID=U4QY18_9FIRM|nr:GyrI-like domain-containing protein [Ruminiclostridium papyrosolvens]EPR08037.1 transcriptional regulator [Ruminiclostridium papyrosolvens C7]